MSDVWHKVKCLDLSVVIWQLSQVVTIMEKYFFFCKGWVNVLQGKSRIVRNNKMSCSDLLRGSGSNTEAVFTATSGSYTSHDCVCVRACVYAYLEWLFVDICIISYVRLPGLAKQDEFLKEENVAETFFLPKCYHELILAYQLALFLQINLQRTRREVTS